MQEFRIELTIITICLLAFLACLGGCHENELTNRKAIEAGLVQKMEHRPGSTCSDIYWTKP